MLFAEDRSEWTLTEAARRLECSPTAAYRMFATLQQLRFVDRDPETKRYRLGPAFRYLALRALPEFNLASVARPVMEQLTLETNETSLLTVREGTASVCIAKVESSHSVRMTARVGLQSPLYAGGSNLPLLAFLTEPYRSELIERLNLKQHTPNTPSSKEALWQLIHEICREGCAVSDGHLEEGISAIGAPVLNAQGYPIACISIAGPRERLLGPRTQHLITLVKRRAEELTRLVNEGW